MYNVQSPTLLDKKLPNLKSQDWPVLAGNRTLASAEGGEHSSKDLFEQPVYNYSEHLPRHYLFLFAFSQQKFNLQIYMSAVFLLFITLIRT